jgi:hypothetical protein
MRDIRKRKNIQRNPLTLKSSTDGFEGLDGKRSKNDCCAPCTGGNDQGQP